MTRIRCALTMLIAVVAASPAAAQFFPPPIIGLPVVMPNGIDFQYNGRRLKVAGFIPTGGATSAVLPVIPGGAPPGLILPPAYYPYAPYSPYFPSYPFPAWGSIDQRVTIQVINPPGIPLRAGWPKQPDLSGIDLDVEPASKIWGDRSGIAKIAKPEPRKIEIAANPPMPAPAPRREPLPDGRRLLELGTQAFKNGEFGLAILRFRQAGDSEPTPAQSVFLQAQALIVIGEYHEAVQLIHKGLNPLPHWPASAFRPRLELYTDAAWLAQQKELEAAQRRRPMNADYLFLLGYLAWFDGQREAAIESFTRARDHAVDATAIDLFLIAAKKKP